MRGGPSRAAARRSRPTSRPTRCSSLRTARRALDSSSRSTATPSPTRRASRRRSTRFSAVDGRRRSASGLDQLIDGARGRLLDQLTTADGHAYGGWDARAPARPPTTATSLDAHTAAIRGLLVAYLATGDDQVPRPRRARVRQRLESAFYDPSARVYRPPRATARRIDVHAAPLRPAAGRAARHLRAHRACCPASDAARAHRGPRRAPQQAGAQRLGRPRPGRPSSSGRASARASARAPTASRSAAAACRWPSASLSGETGSLVGHARRGDAGPRHRPPTASTTASRRSPRPACPSALANSVTFTLSPLSEPSGRADDAVAAPCARRRRCAPAAADSAADARRRPRAPAVALELRSPSAPDGARLFVVHPDADSVTILDRRRTATIVHEILLAPAAPAADPTHQALRPGGRAARARARLERHDALRHRPALGPRLRDRRRPRRR